MNDNLKKIENTNQKSKEKKVSKLKKDEISKSELLEVESTQNIFNHKNSGKNNSNSYTKINNQNSNINNKDSNIDNKLIINEKKVNINTAGCKDGITFPIMDEKDNNEYKIDKIKIAKIKKIYDKVKYISFSIDKPGDVVRHEQITFEKASNKNTEVTSRALEIDSYNNLKSFIKNSFKIGIEANYSRLASEKPKTMMDNVTAHTGPSSSDDASIFISTSFDTDIPLHFTKVKHEEKENIFDYQIEKIRYAFLVIIRSKEKSGVVYSDLVKKVSELQGSDLLGREKEFSRVGFISTEDIKGIYTIIEINGKFFDYEYFKNPNFIPSNDKKINEKIKIFKNRSEAYFKKLAKNCIKIEDSKLTPKLEISSDLLKNKPVKYIFGQIKENTKKLKKDEIPKKLENSIKESLSYYPGKEDIDEDDDILKAIRKSKDIDIKNFINSMPEENLWHLIESITDDIKKITDNNYIFSLAEVDEKNNEIIGYYILKFFQKKIDKYNLLVKWVPSKQGIKKINYIAIKKILQIILTTLGNKDVKIKEVVNIKNSKIVLLEEKTN